MKKEEHPIKAAIKYMMVPLHRSGWMFVSFFAIAAAILGIMWAPLGFIGLLLTAWSIYFFRDPDRVTPMREGVIVSPADGIISKISITRVPEELDMDEDECLCISISLSLFDVHVNRIPINGEVTALKYLPGKFVNTELDKSSEDNERQYVTIKTAQNMLLGVVQIAGVISRRVVCDLTEGQSVKTGDRYGIIRFGSRVNLYLPKEITPLVIEGQRSIGGETVVADIHYVEGMVHVGNKH